ncbi:ABC transporter ATP-binding protein [Corynebacterium lubricantis]|uniref:ATP-binding cassette domain-containing protein n=1 Tax=Corynebacterium lubricantis TaxID=541095 RepID=UPI00036F281C|nr:ABC transporter ATP-binding protein [Corynebacterium lubricantis]
MTSPLPAGSYGLIGPNGAGKTYYLRSLFGPGTASVPASADALFAGDTVGHHLAVARSAKALNNAYLDEFDESAHITDLSVGQRRLLTIAVALAAEEEIVLLDEPFDGLDIDSRSRIRELLIDSHSDKQTLIIASHRAEDFVGLVDSIITVFDRQVSTPVALDEVRYQFPTFKGPKYEMQALVAKRRVIASEELGPIVRVTLAEPLDDERASYPDDFELINLLASRKDAR